MAKYLICIVGPTAVGKTALSIELAQYYKTEILSFDSRQIYKELNIGTAKPTVQERKGIPHHFIDELSITQKFSAGEFQQQSTARLESLFQKYNVVIAVGGTGLYLKALLEGLDIFPQIDLQVRQTLQDRYQKEGLKNLVAELACLDPITYQNIDKHNPRRVLRALEVCLQTGKPYSSFLAKKNIKHNFKIIKIGLNLPRQELYTRINARVLRMIEKGLISEVQNLIDQNVDFSLNSLNTVGYKEIYAYLHQQYDLDTAIDLIQQNTRRYAKRQLTWFRADTQVQWFEPDQYQEILAFLNTYLQI
ncbi:MAG: tRNA (adenosine(37)-N6)-dimethylallyltransferase MiaA [Bacteroidia bacterium]|nr:tRNA (adenosine(37)-N6)-dimethylallyltransferase MiaA [Bacteroidia bacterium]MDW8301638.1 tRNA (adenosine(37)-N6)-dimethylallyltransferase MiaA [Bacteroidia bacterium]